MIRERFRISFIIENLLLILGLIVNSSCDETAFTIGSDLIESQTHVTMIDTFTVSTSTIIIDSMPTSGDSILLVGSYNDNVLGKILSNSFFQIGLPDNFGIVEDDVFDSITIRFYYSGYSYGDTTGKFGFTIHQLREQPDPYDDGYLYNTTKVAYYDEVLASFYKTPRPSRKDSVEITLPYSLGLDFFNRILEDDDALASEDAFLEYFSGLAFIADSSVSNSIIGFKANSTNLNIRIYYHRYGNVLEELYCDLPMTNSDYQFNQILHDFSGTDLAPLITQRNALPSEQSDNKAFLLGGIGIMPKLQFPYLQELINYNRGEILKAELILEPDKASYYSFSLPESLLLYQADKYNRFSDPIYDGDGNVQIADFYIDEIFHESTKYAFDITYFIVNALDDGSYSAEDGLFLSTESSLYTNYITRLILECKNPAPKLKIYYVTY